MRNQGLRCSDLPDPTANNDRADSSNPNFKKQSYIYEYSEVYDISGGLLCSTLDKSLKVFFLSNTLAFLLGSRKIPFTA